MNDFVLKWNDSVITEAFVSKSPDGKPYAILKTNPQHSDQVGVLQDNLYQDRNLESYPKIIDGEACLVVTNFHKMEDLKSALKSVGATSGEPNIDTIKPEKKDLGEMWEEFRHNGALKASGLNGIFGHVLLGADEFIQDAKGDIRNVPQCIAKGAESRIVMSVLYTINSLLYFHYGNGDRGFQTNDALNEMTISLQKSGLNLEKLSYEELIDKYEKDKPFAKKLNDFVADHLIMINESIGLFCNYGMVKTGIENRQPGFIGAGLAGALSSLVAMFVKEKPISEQPEEMLETPWGRIWAWIQANPMAVNGAGNIINSASLVTVPFAIHDAVNNHQMTAKMPAYIPKTNKDGSVTFDPILLNQETSELKYFSGKHDIDTVHQHYSEKLAQDKVKLAAITAEKYGTEEYKLSEKTLKETKSELDNAERNKGFIAQSDKSWQIPATMAFFYAAATFFSTVSSKETSVSSDPYIRYEELLVRAAQKAMTMPQGKERDKAIYLMSASLATHDEVKGLNTDQINDYIHKEIIDLEKNPFNSVGKNNIVKFGISPNSSIRTEEILLDNNPSKAFSHDRY